MLIIFKSFLLVTQLLFCCCSNKENYGVQHHTCKKVDTSKIGLVYLFIPERGTYNSNEKSIFKLSHFYSLLVISRLFRPEYNDRLLFYYIKDKPQSNHYNRWLNDSFWTNTFSLPKIKFIQLDNAEIGEHREFNMHEIIDTIKEDCVKQFDRPQTKSHILLTTSDVIVGPKLMTCFTNDKETENNECYRLLNETNEPYSILFNLEKIHKENDFSGLVIWRKEMRVENLSLSRVKQQNVFKCIFKNDVIQPKDWLKSNKLYEDSFCLYGIESNNHDLQDVFFHEKHSYFVKMIRYFLYNRLNPFKYEYIDEIKPKKIPNIVHLVWFSDESRSLKFIEFLCLKSILAVLKPDKVKIHGDNQPNCDSWKKIKNNPKIEWVILFHQNFKYFKLSLLLEGLEISAAVFCLIGKLLIYRPKIEGKTTSPIFFH